MYSVLCIVFLWQHLVHDISSIAELLHILHLPETLICGVAVQVSFYPADTCQVSICRCVSSTYRLIMSVFCDFYLRRSLNVCNEIDTFGGVPGMNVTYGMIYCTKQTMFSVQCVIDMHKVYYQPFTAHCITNW